MKNLTRFLGIAILLVSFFSSSQNASAVTFAVMGDTQYFVAGDSSGALQTAAKIIKKRKVRAMVAVGDLEGNCDERGSAAYNLSLGEKRATSVKKILVSLGISAAHIKLVSYGNSKPLMNCHEEKCWHENRRVDFVFKQ